MEIANKDNIIDGLGISKDVCKALSCLIQKKNIRPSTAIVMVGDNPASKIYVHKKIKKGAEIGIETKLFHFEANITENELISEIKKINNDKSIHGLIVQLPLPEHIDTQKILLSIDPKKDLDGLNQLNIGLFHSFKFVPYALEDVLEDKLETSTIKQLGEFVPFIPCTPLGCLHLISKTLGGFENIAGKNSVVIGKSTLVGSPMARLLLQSGATTTIAHSRSKDFSVALENADIIVSATGSEQDLFGIKPKENAILIDVGIRCIESSNDDGEKVVHTCGDMDYKTLSQNNKITPVPKGVGPMTVACLMVNSYLACLRNG